MVPKESETPTLSGPDQRNGNEAMPSSSTQHLYIIRHGDRFDYQNPEWTKASPRPGDPPLSHLGHQQARELGLFLNDLLVGDGITSADDITWLSSPFLRCLQTSDDALNAMTFPDAQNITILPEYSVFEYDAKGGNWHDSLPTLEERRHYFPRLQWKYQSLFVPALPENQDAFLDRCARSMTALSRRFPLPTGNKTTALVVVTHAAGCIAMVKAATRLGFEAINPAAPCGLYRLTRNAQSSNPPDLWTMDDCDKPGLNLNGHTDHMSSMSGNTIPWNHFGDKTRYKGYSGPPKSKYAPPELRRETLSLTSSSSSSL